MYQLLHAYALKSGSFDDWAPVDIGGVRLLTIFQTYPSCVCYLYDATNDDNGWLDLYSLPVSVRTSVQTLNQYLTLATGLDLSEENPTRDKGDEYVKFLFAQAYKFKLRGTNANFSPDEDLLPDQKIDILLSRDDITDYTSIVNKSLTTVNGLFFRAWPMDGKGIQIDGGGRAAVKYNDIRVGFLDFTNIGDTATYPITESMIKGGGTSAPLSKGFFIDTGLSLAGKTVGLVIAGKLFLLDNVVQLISESRVLVDFTQVNLLNHFYETYGYLDYSDLGISVDINAVDQVVASEFKTDAVIKAFMVHPQTFLVTIDATGLVKKSLPLKRTKTKALYLSPTSTHPDMPLLIGPGFIAEYNVFERDGFWAVTVPHYESSNLFYETIPDEDRSLVRDQRYGYSPYRPNDAAFVLIKKA